LLNVPLGLTGISYVPGVVLRGGSKALRPSEGSQRPFSGPVVDADEAVRAECRLEWNDSVRLSVTCRSSYRRDPAFHSYIFIGLQYPPFFSQMFMRDLFGTVCPSKRPLCTNSASLLNDLPIQGLFLEICYKPFVRASGIFHFCSYLPR